MNLFSSQEQADELLQSDSGPLFGPILDALYHEVILTKLFISEYLSQVK